MATGIWPSVSGALAQSQAIEVTANNLANADTTGFKKDEPTFQAYLAQHERPQWPNDVPRTPATDADFYPLDARDQAHVVVNGTHTSFKQGNLKVTQGPLDVAIDGPGFFEVGTPSGIRYTRQGSFKLATDGRLVTTEGYPVLAPQPGGLAVAQLPTTVQPGQGRPETTQGGVGAELNAQIAARSINLGEAGPKLHINERGEIYSGGQAIGNLSVVDFKDRAKLLKRGAQYFENQVPENIKNVENNTLLRQGFLEGSNVNPVEEMVRLMGAHRSFEVNLKAMKSHDDLMGKEANEIGRMRD